MARAGGPRFFYPTIEAYAAAFSSPGWRMKA